MQLPCIKKGAHPRRILISAYNPLVQLHWGLHMRQQFTWDRVVKAMPHWSVLAFAALVAVLSWLLLPDGGWDWRYAYAPAARTWWAPWTQGLPLVPWAAVALIPLAALPDRLATTLVNSSSVIAISLVVRRLGGKDWYAVPVMLTPFGYWMMRNGQVDGLILAALLLSHGLDALVLITKPQVAAGAIVARLKQQGTWRRRAIYLSIPFVALLVSFIVWPGWPIKTAAVGASLVNTSWNWAVWPWGLPIGAWLLFRAWRTGQETWGILATPFLFPFVNAHSWLMAVAMAVVLWPRLSLGLWLAMCIAFGWFAAALWGPTWLVWVYGGAVSLALIAAIVRVTPVLKGRLSRAPLRREAASSEIDGTS
jgi:hypothetical protein